MFAGPWPTGRRHILIWGLIKARLMTKAGGVVIRWLLLEHVGVLEAMLKPQSPVGLSATGLASGPEPHRELPQPFPHHTPPST